MLVLYCKYSTPCESPGKNKNKFKPQIGQLFISKCSESPQILHIVLHVSVIEHTTNIDATGETGE